MAVRASKQNTRARGETQFHNTLNMALCQELTQQFTWIIWIFTLLLSESASKKSQTFYMDTDCDKSVLLGGATIYSHHAGDSALEYGDRIDCRITFRAENDSWRLMMQVEQLDIPDTSYKQLCNDAVYVYDAKNIFGRNIEDAGGTGGLCGSTKPPNIYSSGPYLTMYFRTDAGGTSGLGFKIIITAFNEDYAEFASCGDEFHCRNHLCISQELVCDGVNHCGDSTDEIATEPAKCGADDSFIGKILSLGITAAIAITVGTVVVIVVVVVCIVCCCCRCNKKREEPAQTTTTTATSVTINNGAPPIVAHPGYTPLYAQQGYYPIQPGHAEAPPVTYSPYPQRDSNSYSQGSGYSGHPPPGSGYSGHAPLGSGYSSHAPPSYHRSYTPTSSKSGRSHPSSDTMVKYHNDLDKVALPVHL